MPGIDASDLLKLMDPKMTKKQELEQKIIELEKEISTKNVLREKQLVEEEYLAEKVKLDRALARVKVMNAWNLPQICFDKRRKLDIINVKS